MKKFRTLGTKYIFVALGLLLNSSVLRSGVFEKAQEQMATSQKAFQNTASNQSNAPQQTPQPNAAMRQAIAIFGVQDPEWNAYWYYAPPKSIAYAGKRARDSVGDCGRCAAFCDPYGGVKKVSGATTSGGFPANCRIVFDQKNLWKEMSTGEKAGGAYAGVVVGSAAIGQAAALGALAATGIGLIVAAAIIAIEAAILTTHDIAIECMCNNPPTDKQIEQHKKWLAQQEKQEQKHDATIAKEEEKQQEHQEKKAEKQADKKKQ
jgi:hypothetical protein